MDIANAVTAVMRIEEDAVKTGLLSIEYLRRLRNKLEGYSACGEVAPAINRIDHLIGLHGQRAAEAQA